MVPFSSHFPLTSCSVGNCDPGYEPYRSATEKTMDSENPGGHWAIFQGKATYSIVKHNLSLCDLTVFFVVVCLHLKKIV